MNKKTNINPSRLAGHVKLEPRRLLNADFDLTGGSLTLDAFTNDDAGDDRVTISEAGGIFTFFLEDGDWLGDDSAAEISGAGTDTLTIDTGIGALTSILMDSTAADAFEIEFGDFNFTGPMDITNSTGVQFTSITQTAAANTLISSNTLTVSGAVTIDLSNATNDFSVVDVTSATDVSLTDTNGITLTALEATNDATVTAGDSVDIANAVVGNDLTISTTLGNVTDSGNIDVDGNLSVSATGAGSSITMDQLDVAGTIGLTSTTSATIVNTTGVDLDTSVIGTDLDVTATTGDITDASSVTVSGNAQFTSTTGLINLDNLDVTGSIGVDSSTSSTLVNVGDVDLSLSNVGTTLDVTSTTGSITDSGVISVGGDACFDSADSLDLDSLNVTGSIGLTVVNNATLVNATAIDFKASNIGGNLDATATTGDITDSDAVVVGGDACFEATTGAINLDQIAITGSIGVVAATTTDIVHATAVDLKASNVGTDLNVTATTGDITDSGAVVVGGDACFEATAGAINLDQLAVTGSIGVIAATSADIVNTTAVDLKASNVGTNLNVTATTGDITDSGAVVVGGDACFEATAGAINLDQLAVTGSIGVIAATSADIVNTTAVDLKASNVGTNLNVTATTGDVTDSGAVVVGGEACFEATAGAINLDQLAVTGSIGVIAATSADIVNTTAVDLKASNVGTNLNVTATTGDVTDSGAVVVGGDACFEATAGAINLDQLAVTGSIGVIAATSADIVNTTAVDLKASNVGTNLNVTATTGDVTDSGAVVVGGDACFEATAGAINLDQIAVTGSIGVVAATTADIVHATAVDLKASNVGTNLNVTATTGDITDSGAVVVGGDACFEATAGAINLDQLAVTGSIGVIAATSADIVNTTAVDLKASNVGTNLNVTATTGDVTDSGAVVVGGDACFEATAGAINLDQIAVTGSIGLVAATTADIVHATAVDLKASNVGTDLNVTATTGDITDSGAVVVGGDACFEATAGAINLDQLAVTGSIGVIAATSADIVNTTAVDLKASNVGTNLNVTATTGDVTDSGAVVVGGEACFEATAGAISLDQLAVTGSIGVVAATSADIVNTTAVDLKASNVGTDLNVTATTGDVTDSGAVVVGGDACFEATAGAINLDQIAITGSIGVVAATTADIVHATAVDLKASNVGTDLNVTAAAGDVTDSGAVVVGGDACFEATTGAINLDQLAVTGSIGVIAATTADIVNTTAVDLKASNVGTDLNVTATTGDITDSGAVTVGGNADFNSVAGNITLDQVAATLSIGVISAGDSTITATSIIFDTSNVGGNLLATATAGDITQINPVTVTGTTTLFAIGNDICMTDAANDFGGVVTATADVVEFVDANDMTVGVISAADNIFLRAGASLVETGQLTLTGNLTTSNLVGGQTLLQADNGVDQTGGIITTVQLLMGGNDAEEGAGDFVLTQSNSVGAIAADIDGTLDFINNGTIVVDSLTYLSSCGTTETITGLDVLTKIRLRAEGVSGITLNQAVDSETIFLESSAGATQLLTGAITGTNLLLRGAGLFDLNDAVNEVDNLAAEITGQLDYFDNDTLNIARLDCDGQIVCGINVTTDLNLTTNNGDLFQDGNAAVIVGGNTAITTGTGDICLTGGDCDDDGVNDNLFAGTLTITNTGDIVIAENDDLNIDSVTSAGSLRFIGNNIQINTAITADQLLLEASNGVDYNNNVIDVTDLLLSGQGTFEFGGVGDTANVIDNLAADIDGDLNLLNSVDLNIGDLTLISNCGNVNICGVNIDANGALLLDGDFNLQLEDVDLNQTAGIAVDGTTTIAAGTGDICLTGASCTLGVANENDLNFLIIQSADDASIVDSNGLIVNEASVTSQLQLAAGSEGAGDVELAGNVTAGDQVLLQSAGDTSQTGGIIATTDLLLGSESNTNADGGDFTLTNNNTVTRLAAFAEGSIDFVNVGALEIADLTFVNDCGTNETICGVATGANLTLNVSGDLTQSGAVRVGGDADLTSTGGIICLTGADCAALPGVGNDNDFMGTVTASATTVELVDINGLTVGDISATDDIRLVAGDGDGDADLSGAIDGAEVLQSGLLQINGDLTVTAADGQILLESDGGIDQLGSSTITANDLILASDHEATSLGGDFNLVGTNQVDRIAGDIGLDGQSFDDAQGIDSFGDVDLAFNNTINLEIADLTYNSACLSSFAACGLTVGRGPCFRCWSWCCNNHSDSPIESYRRCDH